MSANSSGEITPPSQGDAEKMIVTRGAVGPTVGEDVSFITVRELRDWCREAREYKPPLLSTMTLFSVSLGLFVGFAPAYVSTDVAGNGVWKGVFLFGTILGLIGCGGSLLAMLVDTNRIRKKLRFSEKPRSELERFADRIDGACEKGKLRAAAAEDALREREKADER